MSGTRPVKRGSFGSHFDELVKLFPHEAEPTQDELHRQPRRGDKHDVHDRLFERAWSKH